MKASKVSLCGLCFLLAVVVLLLPIVGIAQGDGFYTVSQGTTKVQIVPLEQATGAVEYYALTNMQSATGFEEANTAVLFMYQDTVSGELSLFVLLGGAAGTAGAAAMTLSGVPAGAGFIVQDDNFDFRDTWAVTPPTGNVTWAWDQARGDGMVLGPLGTEFELTIFPQFTTGITQVKFLSGSSAVPETIALNLIDPIIIQVAQNMPPEVLVFASPAEAHINEPITFDAAGSFDLDGRIVTYEWDFNGDGLFEQQTTDSRV